MDLLLGVLVVPVDLLFGTCWRYAFPFEGKSPFNGFAMVLQPRPVWELNGGIQSDSWKFD